MPCDAMPCIYIGIQRHVLCRVCGAQSKRNRCGCYFGAIILAHSLSPMFTSLFFSVSVSIPFSPPSIAIALSLSLFSSICSQSFSCFCSCIALCHGLHGWRMKKREALRHKRNECSNVILPYPYNHSVAAAAAAVAAIAHSSSLVPFVFFFWIERFSKWSE